MTRLDHTLALTIALLPALGLLAACPPSGGSDSDTDPGADTDTDTDTDWDTEDLRPNVQEGISPNAQDQTPAFPEQTRAWQPAEPTAFSTQVLARGLSIPWGMAELPDGSVLVTERPGRLRVVDTDGTVSDPVVGVPEVVASGQGGLLDVVISPDFATDRAVFLTYSEARGGGNSAPAVARGRLSDDGSRLEDVRVIFRQDPAWNTTRHYGSRLVFDNDGALYVTFGDRGSAFAEAQSADSAIGAVVRILPDGSVPSDNPFVSGGGAPEVWSYGHRNIQSATLGADGALWTVEHGPEGGDELNRPVAGGNHGWPVITYGQDYNGQPIGDGITAQEGMEQPVYYWDPVIAPSGMATYTGSAFADWEGDLLIGGLQSQAVVRLSLRGERVFTEEWLPMNARVRDVLVAADGTVLVAVDTGEIRRIVPE